ncbi:MAG: hypothetical protein K9N49_07735 [Candidatus Marinimicrobia bacterium]|nr:hypothetical protein [Candidatus Neomarinimicrobiota bacterium]
MVEYSYLPGADLLTGWTQSATGIQPVSHTRAFEPNRNLITGIENMAGTNVVSTFAYTNDELARRTLRVDNAAVTNAFAYNVRSEVIEALLGLDQYDYAYDPIGNREWTRMNANTNWYTANELNQYTVISNGIPVEPTYDADGNMLEMGNGWTSTWDGENRLIEMVNGDARLVFTYDYMSRRVRKRVYDGLTKTQDRAYVYDGWNVLLELDLMPTEPELARAYTWGLDLSQSLQGAGGVGGLLSVTTSTPSTTETFSTAFDANGNITEYVDSSGAVVAHYEYDAFGNTITQFGTLADTFAHRFSTKYLDPETGLYYYGYRYYSPELGRWLSNDPLLDPGSVPVMAIRAFILDVLEQLTLQDIEMMLEASLSEGKRLSAATLEFYVAKLGDCLARNEPQFWLLLSGNNLFLFCENNPMIFVDPLGLSFTWKTGAAIVGGFVMGAGIIVGSPVLVVGGGIAAVGFAVWEIYGSRRTIDSTEERIRDGPIGEYYRKVDELLQGGRCD